MQPLLRKFEGRTRLTKPAVELGHVPDQTGRGEGEEAVAGIGKTGVDGDGSPSSVGLVADLQTPGEPTSLIVSNSFLGNCVPNGELTQCRSRIPGTSRRRSH